MNNIQLSCTGNCFTKPLMCWSLLEYVIVIVITCTVSICVWMFMEWKKEHDEIYGGRDEKV